MRLEKALAHAASISKIKAEPAAKPKGAVSFAAGKWTNQYGSTADLVVNGNALSGTYTSQVSSGGGTVSGPITGHITGDILAFSVLWPTPAGSITSWSGQIVDEGGKPTMKTLWHLVINIPDTNEPNGLWETMLAGSDVFTK